MRFGGCVPFIHAKASFGTRGFKPRVAATSRPYTRPRGVQGHPLPGIARGATGCVAASCAEYEPLPRWGGSCGESRLASTEDGDGVSGAIAARVHHGVVRK